MYHCVISQKAHQDIKEVFNFGREKFGEEQALRYSEGLKQYFQLLLQNPYLGRERNEIKKGLLSFPYASHTIFYRVFTTNIRIVRVLHGRRDTLKFLKV